MPAVYSVGTLAELKAINPSSVSTNVGTRALYEGEKRAVLETGFTPSWYTWRPSANWATGIPNEIEPVIIRPTTNTLEGAWVSDSLHKVFSTVKPPDTPPNLFKDVNKGVEWVTTFASGSTARYISDGINWKLLFIGPVLDNVNNPPTVTPDEVGQFYIYNAGPLARAVYFSVGVVDSTNWVAI